jgi:bifunctional DNA-binding transcriptional regulator/antitoxin component of YhaV-PrlF toxin-antitoxin module
MAYIKLMTTTVTTKNMISIPAVLARKFGIKPGFSFDWAPSKNPEEIIVKVIPGRKELSRQLKGAGASYSPGRSAVSELVAERAEEGS